MLRIPMPILRLIMVLAELALAVADTMSPRATADLACIEVKQNKSGYHVDPKFYINKSCRRTA